MKRSTSIVFFLLIAVFSFANVFTVTTTSDGTMLPPGQVSLRQCMLSANSTPGYDSIFFAIPGPGPHTLRPTSQLPILTDMAGVRIDGFTQAGAVEGPNPPSSCQMMIEISGSKAGNASGIWIQSSNNFITGLVVDSFAWDGISIEGVPAPGSNLNWIVSNFVGVNPAGTSAKPNGWFGGKYGGIALWHGPLFTTLNLASMNNILTNLVSGNLSEGITLLSSPPDGDVAMNRVSMNYVGTDITGLLPIGNGGDGIYIGENSNSNVVDMNVVAANGLDGIGMSGFLFLTPSPAPRYVTLNQIYWNIVGMGVDTSTPMGNGVNGIGIGTYGDTTYGFAVDNEVVGNWIAHNGQDGIRVADFPGQFGAPYVDCYRNKLSMNNIYKNRLLGINLGEDTVTLNDPFDADSGANMLYNFPKISNIQWSNGVTYLRTDLTVLPGPGATRYVEYYLVDRDPTLHGEGKQFIKSTKFPAGVSMVIDSFLILMPDDSITAIAWDSANWNTSEFCEVHHIRGPIQSSITQTNVQCFGDSTGSIELDLWWGSGIYRTTWSNGVMDSLRLTGLPAGNYSVTFQDAVTAGGGMHTILITEPAPLTATVDSEDPSCMGCSDGKAWVVPFGGVPPYSYSWLQGGMTDTLKNLSAGSYCVQVTDSFGCIDTGCALLTDPVGIADNQIPDLVLWPNPVESGGQISIRGMHPMDGVKFFDLVGNEIEIAQKGQSIAISADVGSGIYLLRIEREGYEPTTRRVVVF